MIRSLLRVATAAVAVELRNLVRKGTRAAARAIGRKLERLRAAKAWPTMQAPVRACPSCREVAYTPGQTHCTKCGGAL